MLAADAGRGGQRLCLFHPARNTPARGAVLYLHPFAEEMNKARRMAALQSRALADAGFDVLQLDLLGCGDSSGDFGDASWDDWVADALQGARWLAQRSPAPLWLWGLRAGALLASDVARRGALDANFLFWQPALSGKLLLQQFLRLKAASRLTEGNARAVLDEARSDLAQGQAVHVGGYWLSSALAQGLEAATLMPPSPPPAAGRRVVWFEVASRADATLAPASAAPIARWQQAGFEVHSAVVNGPPFWQATEIEDAPALVAQSVQALSTRLPSGSAAATSPSAA